MKEIRGVTMHQSRFLDNAITNIVFEDYRTADVLKKYGLSYCDNSAISLREYCLQKQVDCELLLKELEFATKNIIIPNSLNFAQWKTDFLIDYIIAIHHNYLYQVLPVIENDLSALTIDSKKQLPELIELAKKFNELSILLKGHMSDEEKIIFPYIRQIENTYRRRESYGSLLVKTLRKPLNNVEAEHQRINIVLDQIRSLTGDYSFSDNACISHWLIYKRLREFDYDIIQHHHLENDILFPRAIEIENALLLL